jgi:hypothetical protein
MPDFMVKSPERARHSCRTDGASPAGDRRSVTVIASVLAAAAAFAAVLLLPGCDETLPPRDEPLAILRGSYAMTDTFVVFKNGVILGTAGAFESRVRNLYDDVLEDTAMVKVDYTVALEEFPDSSAAFTATALNVTTPEVLTGRYVTLKPNQDIVTRYLFNHRTSAGTAFWTLVERHPGVTPGGVPYIETDRTPLIVTCAIRTYKRVPAIVLPRRRMLVVYRIF